MDQRSSVDSVRAVEFTSANGNETRIVVTFQKISG
jgi:hypothetical protein